MLFPTDAPQVAHQRLLETHNRAMYMALQDYLQAMAVTISHPQHPAYAHNAGYRMALEDIARAIEPTKQQQTTHQPG